MRAKNLFVSLFFLCTAVSCTSNSSRILRSAQNLATENPERALEILDNALKDESKVKIKLQYIEAIEKIVKKKIKKAEYYKSILEMKLTYLENPKKKNQVLLNLGKLFIQNFKDDIRALNYLEQIDLALLDEEERDLYFKSVLIANINSKKFEQALIEVDQFLNRKDLTPSERFKISLLKARTLVDFKKVDLAEKEYKQLLDTHPNLSKKWKVRSQLALTLEGQKKYREAIEQLKIYSKEENEKDPLLDWRIEELTKRLAQQPGGKGRLKR